MKKYIYIITFLLSSIFCNKILIPMDLSQTNHLKAYGVVFWNLKQGNEVDWLLNFKGGSFLMESTDSIKNECIVRGVQFKNISVNEYSQILSLISENNMDIALLETVPKIAVYSPPGKQPWDDAVTLALTYAEVEYDVIFDEEVLNGGLAKYDWLHLHHEDFTGQYGKFYKNYRNKAWYKNMESEFNLTASKFGFTSVHNLKKNIASIIKNYVQKGGFLFAMCSATDSFDIALSALDCDIAHSVFDGTPIDHNCKNKLNYDNTFAFEKFELITDPLTYEYSNIDIPQSHKPIARGAEEDYFSLFEFSAKWDPVPTMLTQNHVGIVKGFMGQTTAFNRDYLKEQVVILGQVEGSNIVKYIHNNIGKGSFTFLGGHDPEDYRHMVGDPPTDLSLHRNSPGYRLILNNILFPSAKKKKRKT
ncbi:MAG: asparagine synthetase B [Candidatus Marinimicrobia bacterium]|nr:asparagine synthetase B [Candidatus Neomarinimicrobiota bacterium]